MDEYLYVGHVLSSDSFDNKDFEKQFIIQDVVGNMLIRKLSFVPIVAQFQVFISSCYLVGCALWCNSYHGTPSGTSLSVIVTYPNGLDVSPVCPVHLK